MLKASDKKTMVSIMFANNEIGTLFPVEQIAELAQAHGALFHSDAVQAIGHFPIDVSNWPVHFISGAAHKFHGPKGVGFLYMNSNVKINPLIDGGSQERKMRAGTENISGIAGMALALQQACDEMESRRNHIFALRDHLKNAIKANFDGAQINGPEDNNHLLYTVLSVSFPPTPTSSFLLMQLDMKGICASSGSACSSGSSQPSHVIQSTREDDGYVTIRFSFSHFNTLQEIDYTIEQLMALMPQHAVS
jgi:cysteine desulfurase